MDGGPAFIDSFERHPVKSAVIVGGIVGLYGVVFVGNVLPVLVAFAVGLGQYGIVRSGLARRLELWITALFSRPGVSVEEFFAADPGRRRSKEVRLGSDWHDPELPRTRFTVNWIEETGEIYAMSVAGGGVMIAEGGAVALPPPTPTIEILGVVRDQAVLDALQVEASRLRDHPDGLRQLRERLRHPL